MTDRRRPAPAPTPEVPPSGPDRRQFLSQLAASGAVAAGFVPAFGIAPHAHRL